MSLNITPPDIQYGDVFWAHVPGYGSDKPRPWLVISDNVQNKGTDIMMVPLTTHKPSVITEAIIETQIKAKTSYIKCGHVMTVKKDLLGAWEDQLQPATMTRVMQGLEAARTNLHRPTPTKSKQSQPAIPPNPNLPIAPLPSWSHILDLPTDEQAALLKDMSLQHTVKELADHYMVHPQSIHARINKLGQRMSKNNKAKQPKQEPVVAPVSVAAESFDLEATMLGKYLIKLLDPNKLYKIQLKEVQ